MEDEKARISGVLRKLKKLYPDSECALTHEDAFQLTVATILSAQSTDVRVNMTTPELFERYPTARDLAEAAQRDVELIVRSCGFYRNKAKNIIGMARRVVDEFFRSFDRPSL